MSRPVALDLCCGLGGWAAGLVAAGWHVIGVDIEDMFAALGEPKPEHFELVIADICKVRGADYAHVSLIVGSSPCQDFSYRAMPWKRAKAMHAPFLGMWLFWQQFRIQREVSAAKGEHVPMVCENVRGAIPWVGRSRANFGSYHLWGDVPALMPTPAGRSAIKVGGMKWYHPDDPRHVPGQGFNTLADRLVHKGTRDLVVNEDGRKIPGFRFDGSGGSFQTAAVEGMRDSASFDPDYEIAEGRKGGGYAWFKKGTDAWRRDPTSAAGSHKSPARKAASAKIAKIPLVLASWIGDYYHPVPFSRGMSTAPIDERLERRRKAGHQ